MTAKAMQHWRTAPGAASKEDARIASAFFREGTAEIG